MSSDSSHADSSHAGSELPAIDDRLVVPETRYEMFDGELVYVSPADPPHGERHLQLAALIEAHTGPAFEAAADLLTRTSKKDDIAPDISIYPDAPDPLSGGRQLEHLAFEIVSTGSLGHAARKAAKLSVRGVRRVFAIDVERSRALEWSAELGTWSLLDAAGRIEDAALEVPLPVEAMIHAAKADDAIARALLAKGNPVFVQKLAEGRAEGVAEGRAEGLAEAVIMVLTARDLALDEAIRQRILDEHDAPRLERWIVRAMSCATVAELFTER
ncbi:MAG TPA: Uma2 family endonuclease [Kofleriaceae bacterium]|nr:Uma2 family endonuclease [Kofleriaceae bacterium]